jgi:hypothetical protein
MKENPHMHSWAKRGLQTALVTGGLLMLGTGIASADENVNPDTPASPLDLNVTVPLDVSNNAIGTPLGQLNVPGFHAVVSTKPVTAPVKAAAAALDKNLSPVDAGNSLGGGSFDPVTRGLKGNKVVGNVVVPIQITGNAIGALGGDAVVDGGAADQSYSHNQDVATDGKNSGIAGNAVVLDWALPIQIAGNAGGVAGGSGKTSGSASQSASETGNVWTNGKGSGLSGNVVAGQFATPVQVTGNAASYILGNAYSSYDADSSATSGGYIKTNGNGGAGTGNVAGVPIALPVKFNGNAGGVWGSDADAVSNSSADAVAGSKTNGSLNIPTYIETAGNDSFLAGNAIVPQGGLVANVAGVAGSWIGNATTGNALGSGKAGSSSSTVDAGGFVQTTGKDSGASGNIVDPAIALPVEAFGIGGTYIGNAHANHDNSTDVNSGNGSYTNGTGAVLGGNTVNAQPAGAAEVYGIGGSHIGNASGQSTETKTVTAGGYDGTQGSGSSGSGNLVQVPVALPAEVFGVGGSFIGQGSGSGDETKVIRGGGGGSTHDDSGAASSNLVTAPLSVPVQLFAIGGSFIGQGHGKGSTDTTSTAGGDVSATGVAGAVAGNLIQAPISLPVQGHGVGGSFIGIGTGAGDNLTDSVAGGTASTDGHDGGLAGNIVQAPFAGAATVFGDGAVLGGIAHGAGTSDIMTKAGGDSSTNGDHGAFAGDIVGVDGLPIAQVFGVGAAALGLATGTATNTTSATTGGDVTTSGVGGAVAGDIVDFPISAVAQVFGDAVAAGAVAHGMGDNQTTGSVGGEATTDGDSSSLSGIDGQVPLGALVQVFGVPLELIGNATAEATNVTSIQDEPLIDLPIDGSALGTNDLPTLPLSGASSLESGATDLASMLKGDVQRADVPEQTLPLQLNGIALPSITKVPTLPAVSTLPLVSALPALPAVPALPTTLPVQLPTQLPAVSGGLTSLPILDAAKATPDVQIPALAGLDSSPLAMFSKLFKALTGRI